jgi:hypothetical protein
MKTIELKKENLFKIENLRKYQGMIDLKKLKLLLAHVRKTKKEWKK